MKAIVCDVCGKVVLLADEHPLGKAEGIHCLFLTNDLSRENKLDLCEDCAGKLISCARKTSGKFVTSCD